MTLSAARPFAAPAAFAPIAACARQPGQAGPAEAAPAAASSSMLAWSKPAAGSTPAATWSSGGPARAASNGAEASPSRCAEPTLGYG